MRSTSSSRPSPPSLGLEEGYFLDHYTRDPLVLFRIFNYPPGPPSTPAEPEWGVGEHTDYGLLTILKQDDVGGLEVKSKAGWVSAPPIPNAFICEYLLAKVSKVFPQLRREVL